MRPKLNRGKLMYKILGQDGKEYGPVTADTLRQWYGQHRVNGQTRVCPEGLTDWKVLSEIPELAQMLTAPPPPSATALPGAAVPAPVQQSGLAIASLVLGVLSLVCLSFGVGVLLGIPAIITGHIAASRARRAPAQYGGKGLAIAGLALGYCSAALTALLVAFVLFRIGHSPNQPRTSAESIQCVNNLKQIGLAARLYSNDHDDSFPKDFLSMSNELNTPKILCCPADKSRTRVDTWAKFSPANVSYEFLTPGAKERDVLRSPVFRCPIHKHVCFGEGSVERGDQKKPR